MVRNNAALVQSFAERSRLHRATKITSYRIAVDAQCTFTSISFWLGPVIRFFEIWSPCLVGPPSKPIPQMITRLSTRSSVVLKFVWENVIMQCNLSADMTCPGLLASSCMLLYKRLTKCPRILIVHFTITLAFGGKYGQIKFIKCPPSSSP